MVFAALHAVIVYDCSGKAGIELCVPQSVHNGFLNYESQPFVMKKLLALIASFAIMLVTASAFVDKRQEASLGEGSPMLVVNSGDSLVSLDSFQGCWVILSFWSAADARSRMTQNDVAVFMRSHKLPAQAGKVEVVSVNLDRSERLMEEIVKIDNLDENSQFRIDNASMAEYAIQAYRMNEGLRTFVINPEGKLVAADPSVDDLKRIIS